MQAITSGSRIFSVESSGIAMQDVEQGVEVKVGGEIAYVIGGLSVSDVAILPVDNPSGASHNDLAVVDGIVTVRPDYEEVLQERAGALADLKARRNADINRWRLEANKTQFTHNGKVIACDELSRGDIDAVASSIALTGSFPAEFPGAWKAVDNSYILLPTIESFKAMYASMTAQGTANFNRSQQLKTALAAATTQADIDAIVW